MRAGALGHLPWCLGPCRPPWLRTQRRCKPYTLSFAGQAEWLSPHGVGSVWGHRGSPVAPQHSLLGSPSEAGNRRAGEATDGHVPSGRSKSSACSQGFICHWKAPPAAPLHAPGHCHTHRAGQLCAPPPHPGARGASPRASARSSLLGPPGLLPQACPAGEPTTSLARTPHCTRPAMGGRPGCGAPVGRLPPGDARLPRLPPPRGGS